MLTANTKAGRSQDWLNLILAALLFFSPWFMGYADDVMPTRNAWIVGVVLALIAVAGFVTRSILVLFVALAGFGVIAALFGPIKYGILPDHLGREQLPAANALIEGATFIAILTGR